MTGWFDWYGETHPELPILMTAPHSGEEVPPLADWLLKIPPATRLTDVDRFVNRLYEPAARNLKLPLLFTRVHRYAADLNRYPEDVDSDSVQGETAASGTFSKGFHWVITTQGARLMDRPISKSMHDRIVAEYHDAFHDEIARKLTELRARFGGSRTIYHLDCHSMPSQGTGAHLDSGEKRADVVISDFKGKSASPAFKDAVIGAFEREGFRVSYNWPYFGGRITQRYGRPEQGMETIQIELNRALYMDERTREPRVPEFGETQARLERALGRVFGGL